MTNPFSISRLLVCMDFLDMCFTGLPSAASFQRSDVLKLRKSINLENYENEKDVHREMIAIRSVSNAVMKNARDWNFCSYLSLIHV